MRKTDLTVATAVVVLLGLSASSITAARPCHLPVLGPGPGYHPHITPARIAARVRHRALPSRIARCSQPCQTLG